jgi:hypothetical protein
MNSPESILIQLQYAAPVDQLAILAMGFPVFIESQENYQKQSYRNRCHILTSQGILPLVIPVVHQQGLPISIQEAQIDNKRPWAIQHWRSLISGYNKSPYFAYYKHYFEGLYLNPPALLFDFNMQILAIFCKIVKLEMPQLNTSWEEKPSQHKDLRSMFHPKQQHEIPAFSYYQTFETETGFIENLSVFDLIFNEGPEAGDYLNKRAKMLFPFLY